MAELRRFPSGPGVSPEYNKLYELLGSTDKTVITDEELESCAGRSCAVGGKCYGTLSRVIKRLESTGRTWRRKIGAGAIARLDDKGKLEVAHDLLTRSRRASKRGVTVTATVDSSKLPAEERGRANALSAQLGAIALMSTSATTKKIESRAGDTVADVAAVMDLIIGKRPLRLAE